MPDPIVNHVTDDSSTIGGKISDAASQIKNKLSDLGRSAGNTIDEKRVVAASSLEKAATSLHDTAEHLPGVETVTGMAHDAANKMKSTAEYMRSHNVNRMMSDVETLVKNNPGPSLIAAVVIGFLTARAFRSDS